MTTKIRVRAKKSLGQNFLVNEGVLDRIVAAAALTPDSVVVEVGPGTGALTRRLAATGARVIAVEKDARLIGPLRALFATSHNVSIIEGDVLRWQPELPDGSYTVVANIPYYLTSRLLRQMLEQWPRPSSAVLMVQSEVANRILATPPDMNLLALSVRLFAEPSRIMKVSRGSFRPIPDVDSAIVKLDRIHRHHGAASVLGIAKRAFAHKRKQLRASLSTEALRRASVLPEARPQELSVDAWQTIAQALH